jgi:hypothetical protein
MKQMRYSRNSSYPASTPPALTVVVHRRMIPMIPMNRSPMRSRIPYRAIPS